MTTKISGAFKFATKNASFAVLLALMFAVPPSLEGSSGTSVLATQLASSQQTTDMNDLPCWNCGGGAEYACAETEHIDGITSSGSSGDFSGRQHEGCTVSPDPELLCQEHDWCAAFDEDLSTMLDQAIISEADSDIEDFVRQHADRIQLQLEPGALTLLGCGGREIATVALDKSRFAAIRATLELSSR
jgi:hypothetical protein